MSEKKEQLKQIFKEEGLEITEEFASRLASVLPRVFKRVAAITENKVDDFFASFIDMGQAPVQDAIDKIDGEDDRDSQGNPL